MTRKKGGQKKAAKRSYAPRFHTPQPGRRRSRKVFITSSELRELITNQLGSKLSDHLGLYLADGKYYCSPIRDAREIIKASLVDRKEWVEEKFDCDDFAHVLKAHFAEAAYKNGKRRKPHCFGVVWGSLPDAHAINWMVNADKKLRFVEPQTDRIFFPRRTDKDIYFMQG